MGGAHELYSVLAAIFLYKPNFPLHIFGQDSIKLAHGTNFLIFEV